MREWLRCPWRGQWWLRGQQSLGWQKWWAGHASADSEADLDLSWLRAAQIRVTLSRNDNAGDEDDDDEDSSDNDDEWDNHDGWLWLVWHQLGQPGLGDFNLDVNECWAMSMAQGFFSPTFEGLWESLPYLQVSLTQNCLAIRCPFINDAFSSLCWYRAPACKQSFIFHMVLKGLTKPSCPCIGFSKGIDP